MPALKAKRYLDQGVDPDLAAFIEHELHYLSFDSALRFYEEAAPAMREIDFAFTAANDRFLLLTGVLRRPDAIHPWLYERIREVEADPDDHLDLWSRFHYKMLPVDEPIFTPEGWRAHGDLRVGDEVFHPSGKPVRIIATTPVWTDGACYRITFDKGFSIIAGAEHLWAVDVAFKKRLADGKRGSHARKTISTRDLKCAVDHAQSRPTVVLPSIPVNMPLQFEPASLPIAPYVLGAWLGDGTSSNGNITCADQGVWDAVAKHYEVGKDHTPLRTAQYRRVVGLSRPLKQLGLKGQKHVPRQYFLGSIEQRFDLLRGLMDTDGHCDSRGTATFVNVNERLAKDVHELACSLGLKPSLRKHVGKYAGKPYSFWHVSFQARADRPAVFGLTRKQDRETSAKADRSIRHAIVSVEPVDPVPCSCIQVDAADGLYLVGRELIPTHNSTVISFAGTIQEIINDPEITIAIFGGSLEIARPFLDQIATELEENELLKSLYSDVFWASPRIQARGMWDRSEGITVKRRGNPRERTVEAHGLVNAMPTGKHFKLRIYDDLVNENFGGSAELETMIRKVMNRWELSQNLGAGLQGDRKQHCGTRYCTTGDMRVTMADDWSMRPIRDVQVGDKVVGWAFRDGKRYLQPTVVVNRGVHPRQPVNTYRFENGRSVTCTADHKWWRGVWGSGPEFAPLSLPRKRGYSKRDRQPRGTRWWVQELHVPQQRNESFDAGWLSGMFDGEGTVWKNKGHASGQISIAQSDKNIVVIEEMREVLRRLGFEWREHWVEATPERKANQRMLHNRVTFHINGGWRARHRFLIEIAPARVEKLIATLFAQMHTEKVLLFEIAPAGKADVHWLETETGNYIVEGFCSSNSYADPYGQILERGSLKPRIYPATNDGTLKGSPVMLSAEKWEALKRDQRSTVAAQMLLNPIAGNETMFRIEWLRPYAVRPRLLNVYILVDPSKGRSATSDRTAMAVIGVDPTRNRYLLDGVCHRMKMSERYQFLKELHRKWDNVPGVQAVYVGYEMFGQQTDDEYFEERMVRDDYHMAIEEVNWPRESMKRSKRDRVERLEPYFRHSQFFMPPKAWHPDHGACFWKTETDAPAPVYAPVTGETRAERECRKRGELYRIMEPIMRKDEQGNIYDVFRTFVSEFIMFPFAQHDDLIDAVSRIQDMEPTPPAVVDRVAMQPIEAFDA